METELPEVNRVDSIHDALVALKGQQIRVRANMGRSRIIECTGTLVQAHPSLFIIEIVGRRGRVSRQSYQYVDILTGTVEIFDVNTGESLFDFAADRDPNDIDLDDSEDLDDDE
ncbi:MAG: Veg family protein [Atopobiaceae bacterium]|nr:Veg family protein [Atopobiaceae bacterium]